MWLLFPPQQPLAAARTTNARPTAPNTDMRLNGHLLLLRHRRTHRQGARPAGCATSLSNPRLNEAVKSRGCFRPGCGRRCSVDRDPRRRGGFHTRGRSPRSLADQGGRLRAPPPSAIPAMDDPVRTVRGFRARRRPRPRPPEREPSPLVSPSVDSFAQGAARSGHRIWNVSRTVRSSDIPARARGTVTGVLPSDSSADFRRTRA